VHAYTHKQVFPEQLTSANALDMLRGYDCVLDGSDNFPTKYLVNDACALLGIPNVYGAILGFEGQISVFTYKGGPNYRCMRYIAQRIFSLLALLVTLLPLLAAVVEL
jgi:sulfur-carrier protein adenylyltransferase/sulfurtransferase